MTMRRFTLRGRSWWAERARAADYLWVRRLWGVPRRHHRDVFRPSGGYGPPPQVPIYPAAPGQWAPPQPAYQPPPMQAPHFDGYPPPVSEPQQLGYTHWTQRPPEPAYRPSPPVSSVAANVPGMVASGLGVVLILAAFLVVTWIKLDFTSIGEPGNYNIDFGDLHTVARIANSTDSSPSDAFLNLYFGWAAWLFAIIAGASSLLSNLKTNATSALRLCGAITGIIGAVATFAVVVDLSHEANAGISDVFSFGPWVAITGFVACAVGAGMGGTRRPAGWV